MLQSKIHNSKSKILFFFLLPSVFSVVILLASLCHAQTEIEGEVSGVWTAEDSPYIITDSTWVPEDSTLTIEAGVVVQFEEGIGLDVFGYLNAFGTEEDSIYFTSTEDTIRWAGIRLQENSVDSMKYTIVERCGYGFEMEDRSTLWFSNSRTDVELMPMGNINRNVLGTDIEIMDCVILGGMPIYNTLGGIISISGSLIRTGGAINNDNEEGALYGWGIKGNTCDLIADNSILYGTIGQNPLFSVFTNCEFKAVNDTMHAIVRASYRLVDCKVEGSVSVHPFFGRARFSSSIIERRVVGDMVDLEIDSCEVLYGLNLDNLGCLSVSNSLVGGSIVLSTDSWDNCEISLTNNTININNPDHSQTAVRIRANNDTTILFVKENLIYGRLSLTSLFSTHVFHNTILIDSIYAAGIYIRDSNIGHSYLFDSNIVFVQRYNEKLFFLESEFPNELIELKYNCFWGYDTFVEFRGYDGDSLYTDTTNIIEDPQFYSIDPIQPELTWESPCIDAGNPEFPEDPDGSRADMRAFWFDHELSAEPVASTLIPHPSAFILSSVYPNPFNSHLSIDLDASLPVQVAVYDPLGRVVKSGHYHQRYINLRFDDSHLPTGTYFLYINDGRQNHVQQLTLLK